MKRFIALALATLGLWGCGSHEKIDVSNVENKLWNCTTKWQSKTLHYKFMFGSSGQLNYGDFETDKPLTVVAAALWTNTDEKFNATNQGLLWLRSGQIQRIVASSSPDFEGEFLSTKTNGLRFNGRFTATKEKMQEYVCELQS